MQPYSLIIFFYCFDQCSNQFFLVRWEETGFARILIELFKVVNYAEDETRVSFGEDMVMSTSTRISCRVPPVELSLLLLFFETNDSLSRIVKLQTKGHNIRLDQYGTNSLFMNAFRARSLWENMLSTFLILK